MPGGVAPGSRRYSDARLSRIDRKNLAIIASVRATVKQPEPLADKPSRKKRPEKLYGWGSAGRIGPISSRTG